LGAALIRSQHVDPVRVRLQHAVEGMSGALLEIPEGATHVVGGGRDLADRIQDGALEVAQAGEAQGLDRAHHRGV
jgi:hypothetical protein